MRTHRRNFGNNVTGTAPKTYSDSTIALLQRQTPVHQLDEGHHPPTARRHSIREHVGGNDKVITFSTWATVPRAAVSKQPASITTGGFPEQCEYKILPTVKRSSIGFAVIHITRRS